MSTPREGSALSPLDTALCVAALFVLCFVGYHLMPRGINLSDEGFLLQQSLDMLDGKVLYRDIEMFIAPGIWFLVAGLFSVVEPSVLSSRIVAAISYFALAAVIFRIVRANASARYGAVCVTVYAVLAVWSFPHWTWAWYSPYSILFALLALHALLLWRDDRRSSRLLWAGAFVGLTAIFKQNYGFFALVASALAVIAVHFERRESPTEMLRSTVADGLRLAGGLAAAILPLLVYFGYHGALYSMYDRFFLYPLEFTTAANIPYLDFSALWDPAVFGDRVTSTNYLAQLALNSPADIPFLPSSGWIHLLHAILYWIPPLVFIAGLALSCLPRQRAQRVDGVLFASTAMSGLLFIGIFPRADYTHLVTVYQPILITGALVWHRLAERLPDRPPPWVWAPVASAVALFAFYSLAAFAWLLYLLGSMTEVLPQPRGGVKVHVITSVGINQLVEVVRRNTAEGEAFFGLPDMAMINFLAERPVPGSQYQTYAHMIARDEGALTTLQLDRANVRFAIARYDNVLSTEPRLARYAPILARYLEQNFDQTWMIQNDQYILLERRARPLPPVETVEVLEDCRFVEGNTRESSVRQHLFFASLFQPLQPDAREQWAESRCRVHVPENATLALQIGYKHPIAAEAGASLRGQVSVIRAEGDPPEPILDRTIPVQTMNVDGIPVPAVIRADLSHLGGRDVALMFRTERHGRVKLSPFTIETYGMFWQNPVLETRGSTPPAEP